MNKNNIDQLTILRFIAALFVVIYHYGKDTPPFNYDLILPIVSKGSVFVSFFFVLSGFVLTITYYHKQLNTKDFYIRRFCRIYPIFLFSVIFTFLVFLLISRNFPPLDPFIQLSLLNAWIPKYSLAFNYVGWSISVEIFFYLLFPILLLWVKKINRYYLTIIILFVWVLNQLITTWSLEAQLTEFTTNFVYFNPLFHLNEFLFGVLGGVFYTSFYQSKNIHKFYFVFACLLFFILIQFDFSGTYYRNGLYAPLFILIIYFASTGFNIAQIQNKTNYFVILGESSYSLYILQMPVLILIATIFHDFSVSQPSLFFYLYLLTLIIISIMTYTLIEVPSKKKLLQLLQKVLNN